MAITTLDGLLAGMDQANARPAFFARIVEGGTAEAAGIEHSQIYYGGSPGAAAAPSPGLAGAALTTYAGCIPFNNPAAGFAYLANLQAAATRGGNLYLNDRLWHNSGLTVTTTTAQTVNSVTFPARDKNGSTNGEDVQVAIEVSTATTNAGAITNTTMSYTNQDGTAGRTATIPSFPATAVQGVFVPFRLQAGDRGVRSIQSVTLGTSYGGGAIHLVAFRRIAIVGLVANTTPSFLDFARLGMPRLFNDSVLFPTMALGGTAHPNLFLRVGYAHG
jgi:hypothetical protein